MLSKLFKSLNIYIFNSLKYSSQYDNIHFFSLFLFSFSLSSAWTLASSCCRVNSRSRNIFSDARRRRSCQTKNKTADKLLTILCLLFYAKTTKFILVYQKLVFKQRFGSVFNWIRIRIRPKVSNPDPDPCYFFNTTGTYLKREVNWKIYVMLYKLYFVLI